MGRAYICDRCGESGVASHKRIWQISGGHGHPPLPHAKEQEWYLCVSCHRKLREFMGDV